MYPVISYICRVSAYGQIDYKSRLQMQIVGRDSSVEKITIFVAKAGSISYFSARILVVAPAGIAARRTQIPKAVLSSGRKRQTA